MYSQFKRILLTAGLVCQLMHPSSFAAERNTQITAIELQEDFALLKKSIARVHPEPAFSVDMKQLDAAFNILQRKLNNPMTPDQAWRAFSALNPVFNDAHLHVAMNGHKEQAVNHLKEGGGLFPYEVHVDVAGNVFIKSDMGGAPSKFASMRIETINGRSARLVARELLALAMGDSPALRANLLSGRWWRFYLRAFGTPSHFDVSIATPDGLRRMRVAAARTLPASFADEKDFDRTYRFDMLDAKTGLLTINAFLWPDKNLFYAFTEKVFAQLREVEATTLIIDVRENTGGDDDMWKRGLLRYIADRPYQHFSMYRKKVIEGRQSATEKVGDVITGGVVNWEKPELDNPHHFAGKVYVLVGRTTYSSSILFANVMQDYKFGTLVGAGGYARARQSGGIQDIRLPHTGLSIIVPRFVLERPSGLRHPELLQPDLVLPDSPFDSREIINALHQRIRAAAEAGRSSN